MMKFIASIGIALGIVFASTSPADAQLFKKVDQFTVIVDQSGSMYMKGNSSSVKMARVKSFLLKMNDAIPASLKYDSHFTLCSGDQILYMGNYKPETFKNSIYQIPDDQAIFGRLTDLSSIIKKEFTKNKTQYRKSAVIFVTDGDWNIKENPVPVLKRFNLSKPPTELYIISLADTDNGMKTINDMKSVYQPSHIIPLDKLNSQNDVNEFVKRVFYVDYTPVEIYFDFDKYNIRPSEEEKIAKLKAPDFLYDFLELVGWTCTIGSDKYNQKLSQKRADEVSKHLNAKVVEGKGKSHKYNNKDKSEIQYNRRVDVVFY